MSENAVNNSDLNKDISFLELTVKFTGWIKYLLSRWIIILLIGFLGCISGYVYAFFQKSIYVGTITFALEDDKAGGGGLTGALGLASSLGIDLGTTAGGAFSGANLIEFMKSRRMVEQTLLKPVIVNGNAMSLVELYFQFTGERKKWVKNGIDSRFIFLPDADRSKFNLNQDSLLGQVYDALLDKKLSVYQQDKKISIITIDVKSENETFSKSFAENLVNEVSKFYIETKTGKAKMNVSILQKQTDSIRGELNQAITGVAAANDNTFNLNPGLNILRTPSTKRQVDIQANTAILIQLVTNLELAKVTLRRDTPLIQLIDSPILPLQKEQLGKLKAAVLGGFCFVLLTILTLSYRKYFF